MTTDPVSSGLQPFSQLKAGPTTSSSRSTAVPTSPTSTAASQFPNRQPLKNNSRDEQLNGSNDKAMAALVRRVLCPQPGNHGSATSLNAPEELLPPLTSSNDVDRQLYTLVAMIIKEFISSWYSKITSDQALINEVLQLIAHLTRALEQRLRGTDIAQLVLDDIPALVEAHIICTLDIESVTQQRNNEEIYRRLLMDGVLAVLLPTEDLENACLRTLLSDILSDLILGNQISGKVCEGWFLWDSTTKLLDMLSRDNDGHGHGATEAEILRPNQLQQFGLLSSTDDENDRLTAPTQSQVSSWIWQILQYGFSAYVTLRFIVAGLFRNAFTPPVIPNLRSPASFVDESTAKYHGTGKRPVLDYRLFGMLSQLLDVPRRMPWLGGLLALFQYFILAGPGKVGDTGSVLDRFLHENIEEYVLTPALLPNLLQASREALFPQNPRPKPELSVNRGEVLTSTSPPTLPMPGAPPSINATQTTTASGDNAITPSDIATTVSPDQQRHPSPAEVASIRRKCALGILSLVPRPIARRLFGVLAEACPGPGEISSSVQPPAQSPHQSQTSGSGARMDRLSSSPSHSLPALSSDSSGSGDDSNSDVEESLLASAIESDVLDLFADEYCNKHLVYSIIETVLAKLLPELSDRSISELMEDRAVLVPAA
ncbi:hypothetical protein BDW74DRAFT_164804 [Aspergillus multicolor]|uniref:PXA domain-containing protein n=1 Tax=Aspergillus multicolor TaxID=41759 RepID=UPI003CCE0979